MTQPLIFISYSRKDEREKDRLLSHLAVLQREGLIGLWSDDQISPGASWEEEIGEVMAQAKVAILLISVNFLTSDFILGQEVPTLLQRCQSEGLTVFPVIAKACAWQEVGWLAGMNIRPRHGRPIWGSGSRRVDEDLAAIAKEVAAIIRTGSPAAADSAGRADTAVLPAVTLAPHASPRLNEYQLLGEVGAGNFGRVYRASQPSLGREVAIKMIRPEYSALPEFTARFQQEARLIAQLEHPHIVPLYDYWSEGSGAYLVMRWLGENLRQALNRQPLPLVNCVRLVEQVGEALAMAHAAGIVHCDIKPDNIMYDDRGNFYLSDFGIAREILPDIHSDLPNGNRVGTLAYSAPEQIEGTEITPATDIYSLGITIYEALTGEHPYPLTSPERLVIKHLREPIPSVLTLRPNFPKAIDAVLRKATAKNPKERFNTIQEFVANFSAAANLSSGVNPTAAQPGSGAYDIFLSYTGAENAALARQLKEALAGRGLHAFAHAQEVQQAGPFESLRFKALQEANCFVCLLDRNTLAAPAVLEEIEYAHNLDKRLVPVFLETFPRPEALPPFAEALLDEPGVTLSRLHLDEVANHLVQLNNLPPSAPPETLPARPRRKRLQTLEERNRYHMLSNVRQFWVESILGKPPYHTGLMELTMRQVFGMVDNPWEEHIRPDEAGETLPPGTRILDMFDKCNGKLLILGEPGGGKTTLLLALARDLLERAEGDDAHPIPIILHLSSWGEERLPFQVWLVDELLNQYQVGREIARTWLQNDQVQLLLDGLDEVGEEHRAACIEAINQYRRDHGLVDIVVCVRTLDYKDLGSKLHLNGAVVLEPLTDGQVDFYLSKLGREMEGVRWLLAGDKVLRELGRSPLMLNIITLVYRDLPPDALSDLKTSTAHRKYIFDTYVKRMLERRRERPYPQEETVHYLQWLARKMQDHNQSVFLIEKMQPRWLTQDQRQRYLSLVRWLHVPSTALVYGLPCLFIPSGSGFTGWLLGLLLALVGVGVAWVYTGPHSRKLSSHILIGLSYGLAWGVAAVPGYGPLAGLVLGVGIAFIMAVAFHVTTRLVKQDFDEDIITIVERLDFSLNKVHPLYGLVGFIIGTGGVLSAYLMLRPPGISLGRVVLSVLGGGLIFGAFWLFNSGLSSSEVTLRKRPNEAILRAFRNSSIFYLVTAFMYLAYALLAIGSVTSFEIGLLAFLGLVGANGYTFWFMYGGYNVIQHLALRLVLYRAGAIPLKFAHFLDYTNALALMYKVGGGYIFVHRYLLEYFAAQVDNPETV